VVNGFSLLEVRKLYLDEMYEYHEHLFFTLEKTGVFKEGTYDKMMSMKNKSVPVEDTINQLRKQMFKTIVKKP
jgi:hypothetical protein